MDRTFKIRVLVLGLIWLPLAFYSARYAFKKLDTSRFEFLVSSHGVISSLQREDWLQAEGGARPEDQILSVNGIPFDYAQIQDWLSRQPRDEKVELLVNREGKKLEISTFIKRFSKNDIIILFVIPFILSVIFLGFALGISYHRETLRKYREAVEVFSTICAIASIFFLVLFPAHTLGLPLSFSWLTPLLSALVMHLFLIYPKEKASRALRYSFLGCGYGFIGLLWLGRILHRPIPFWATDVFVGLCLLLALGSLGNTLLTSKDFWARRRARLLSLVVLLSFVTATSMFWAVIWDIPQVSLERILTISLIFPALFTAIFLKENVFNLERVFKRGAHQLLILGMAVTFALLVGLGWSEWTIAPGREWMVWVSIAIVVIVLARPAGAFFENRIHLWIKTKVPYPKVEKVFTETQSLTEFLTRLCQHFESHLNMKLISVAFFQDPTQAWKAGNEQVWEFRSGELVRNYANEKNALYSSPLLRGDLSIGEIRFDGGDALAFDPSTSEDWADCVRDCARVIEILCLREFIAIQQSFLAVGRMQSLLAHQMKNPLAIIKVCAGLLAQHMNENEEAEELLKTIQDEVARVSLGIQRVFEHSSKVETRQKIHLGAVLSQVKENVLSRFPGREFEVSYFSGGKPDDSKSLFAIWLEKEGLRQSLSNLVVNAYEAGSTWVGIEVHFSREEFSLYVRDRGPGLVENFDLFKPFVTTKSHGTGLGLAHVKAFMDRNSGQIRVQSKRGEGTTFILDFPMQWVLNESV